MPSTVLNDQIPYSILFPKKSLFPIEPRIFGSTCYVRDVRPFVTKLDPKALKCVFLGYSRLQKGYRCFSPDLNKYVVSTDVVFSEDTPFYSSPPNSESEEEGENWHIYQETIPSTPTDSSEQPHAVVDLLPTPTKPPIVQEYSKGDKRYMSCTNFFVI